MTGKDEPLPEPVCFLRQARESRNWTLEDVVGAANRMSGGGRVFDVRQLSEWERGVHYPSARNRVLLARIFDMPAEALLAPAAWLPTVVMGSPKVAGLSVNSLMCSYGDLMAAMCRVVQQARQCLLLTGSRSRDENYLHEVERALAVTPDLVHYRVLYGPPHRQVLKDHLIRLLTLRLPRDRPRGRQTLHVGLADPTRSPERFLVVSEREAVVIIPSLTSAWAFDSGIVCGHQVAARLLQHGREAYASSIKIETVAAVQALPVVGRASAESTIGGHP